MFDHIRQSFEGIKKTSSLKKKISIATKLSEDIDLNRLNEKSNIPEIYPNTLPAWLFFLLTIEKAAAKLETYEERKAIVEPFIALVLSKELDFGESRQMSMTGILCYEKAWVSALGVAKYDSNLNSSAVPIAMNCIVRSKDEKDIPMSIITLERLLNLGIDLNQASDKYNVTALIKASSFTNIPLMKWLLENGANPDVRDNRQEATAWMHCLNHQFGLGTMHTREHVFHAVKLLIENKADIHLRPTTKRDFSMLVSKSKFLEKSEKDRLIKIYEGTPKGKETVSQVKKGRKARTKDLLEIVSKDEISKHHGETDFLLRTKDDALIDIVFILNKNGIQKFYAGDVLDLVKRELDSWSGYKPTFSLPNVEDKLDEFLIHSKDVGFIKHDDLMYEIQFFNEFFDELPKISDMVALFKEIKPNT